MFQTLSVYQIPDSEDPDEFWRYHVEVHARDVARAAAPYLRRYVIKRRRATIEGEPHWFGSVEMWWDSPEDRIKAFSHADTLTTASGKNTRDDFFDRVTFEWYVEVEEVEIPLESGEATA